jgi:hypothetical protein
VFRLVSSRQLSRDKVRLGKFDCVLSVKLSFAQSRLVMLCCVESVGFRWAMFSCV